MDRDPAEICESALRWARSESYAGYEQHDGLNSPLLSTLDFHWFPRLVAIHSLNKSPVNLHSLLGVPKKRHAKGTALFAMAYFALYRESGEEAFLAEGERLLEWLLENQSDDFDLPCWGIHYNWQNGTQFYLRAGQPTAVVTVFAGYAFLEHHEITGEEWSLEAAHGAAEFVHRHINTVDVRGFDAMTYTPYDSFVVLNVNAVAADLFWRVSEVRDGLGLADRAEEVFAFLERTQREDGAWYYSEPASDAYLSVDNYHTGFVLMSLYDYVTSGAAPAAVEETYDRGMAFYRENLFEPNGAPKFSDDQSRPHDAHSSGTGIATFLQRGTDEDLRLAERIYDWTVDRMYDPEGYFYRRIGRVFEDRIPYMRNNQAWMAFALGRLVESGAFDGVGRVDPGFLPADRRVSPTSR
jgi:hypothetical protein